ncbi:MAG: ABC transporter substrate-binding protein [Casimicrobiaceae bacterium]
MSSETKDGAEALESSGRRTVLKAGAAAAGASVLGFPAIVRAQSDKIKIGHLTPLSGFLGTVGGYARLGVNLALEEVNQAGGIMGRQVDLIAEDSVNPSVASTKAQRLLEQDKVALLLGEINSASALTISQVAGRNQKVFFSTGARSDALRGKSCNRFMFHMDTSTTANVKGVGTALVRDRMIQGKKLFTLTADYVFGHDLLKAAKGFIGAHQGTLVGDELIATDVTDFSPYLLKIRQAQPDVVCSNLAGNQVTTFLKQYAEYGLKYPIVGFNLNTADAWGAGYDNFGGIWPMVWYHTLDVPSSRAFVEAFIKKNGKPPEHHAWTDYLAMKVVAQSLNEIKTLDPMKLIEHLEKGAEFDILKARKGHFRNWDHQMLQEEYTVTLKTPKSAVKDKWDILQLGPAVPAADQPLDVVATTREENNCTAWM